MNITCWLPKKFSIWPPCIYFLGIPSKAATADDADRMSYCLKVLSDRTEPVVSVFNEECRTSLAVMLAAKTDEETDTTKVNTGLSA